MQLCNSFLRLQNLFAHHSGDRGSWQLILKSVDKIDVLADVEEAREKSSAHLFWHILKPRNVSYSLWFLLDRKVSFYADAHEIYVVPKQAFPYRVISPSSKAIGDPFTMAHVSSGKLKFVSTREHFIVTEQSGLDGVFGYSSSFDKQRATLPKNPLHPQTRCSSCHVDLTEKKNDYIIPSLNNIVFAPEKNQEWNINYKLAHHFPSPELNSIQVPMKGKYAVFKFKEGENFKDVFFTDWAQIEAMMKTSNRETTILNPKLTNYDFP